MLDLRVGRYGLLAEEDKEWFDDHRNTITGVERVAWRADYHCQLQTHGW